MFIQPPYFYTKFEVGYRVSLQFLLFKRNAIATNSMVANTALNPGKLFSGVDVGTGVDVGVTGATASLTPDPLIVIIVLNVGSK
ncbi:MAG: hypothetical protein U9N36_03390 [Euryarchaeota archaeon]|nr:hypothetical protein [Euryarchaeota archaeon]